MEGLPFTEVFQKKNAPEIRDAVFSIFQSKEIRSVRTRRYKLIRNFSPRRLLPVPVDMKNNPKSRVKCPVVQLFDLENDPHEFNDVAQDPAYAEIYEDLSNRLWDWLEQVKDPILKGPLPTPYYHEAMATYPDHETNK